MTVQHHEDLRAWQLCFELRNRLLPILARPGFKRERRFCEDFTAALDSAVNNIAEGFWRYKHPEFAHFTSVALSSVGEVQSHLARALTSHYITPEEHADLRELSERALRTARRLHKYLRSTPTPNEDPSKRSQTRRRLRSPRRDV